jgi:SAM-dependent methyltransferase
MTSTYDAELYDLTTPASIAGDVEWYRQLALAADGPVLELGAGTGRITLELARAGVDVVALDSSAEMLARLTAKLDTLDPQHRQRVTTLQADMSSFSTEERFGLVIAPFRAFLHNLTEETQAKCTARVFEHLRPRGTFSLNVFHPSLSFMTRYSGDLEGTWRLLGDWMLDDGGFVLRSETTSYDTVRKLLHSRHRFERFDASGKLTAVFLQRLELAFLFPQDLKHLLGDAGFCDIEIFGGFDRKPFQNDRDELVVIATRP